MFPCLISKAATVDVISNAEGANGNGAVQLVRTSFFSILLFPFVKNQNIVQRKNEVLNWFTIWL